MHGKDRIRNIQQSVLKLLKLETNGIRHSVFRSKSHLKFNLLAKKRCFALLFFFTSVRQAVLETSNRKNGHVTHLGGRLLELPVLHLHLRDFPLQELHVDIADLERRVVDVEVVHRGRVVRVEEVGLDLQLMAELGDELVRLGHRGLELIDLEIGTHVIKSSL